MLEINRVYERECLKGMEDIESKSVDLIMTDPPYFVEALKEDLSEQTIRGSSKNAIFYNKFDHFKDVYEYKYFITQVLQGFKRILKDKGQVYMFFSYHHIDWCIPLIKKLGFRYYKPLIWYKPDTMGIFPNQYGCNYENILWFRNNNQYGKVKLKIGCSQRDVFTHYSTNINYRKECGFHPTPKPIKIIRQLITNATDEGDLVFDGFMGSGTTAVAAKQIKRNYIGFEINPEYIYTTNERLKQSQIYDYNTLEVFKKDDAKTENSGNIKEEKPIEPERNLGFDWLEQ